LVPDPGFFDGEQKRFSDWWRGMKLFLKFNKVDSLDMKITAIISQMRGGTAGNFATHWTDKVVNTDDTVMSFPMSIFVCVSSMFTPS
jgi:hypothetical protein